MYLVSSALHYAVNCIICPCRYVELRIEPRRVFVKKVGKTRPQLIFNCASAVIQPSYFRRSRDAALDTRSAGSCIIVRAREGTSYGAFSVHQRRPLDTSRKASNCVTSLRKFRSMQFGYYSTLYTVPRLKAC